LQYTKGKAIDLYSAFLCTPKAGGQATSNAYGWPGSASQQ